MTTPRDSSAAPSGHSSSAPPTSTPSAGNDSSSWMTERIVFISVGTGPTKKKFPVHEKLITHNSPFFDDYFNRTDEPGEPAPELLRLPDIDVNIFSKFMSWVYATSWAADGAARVRNFRFPLPGTPEAGGMTVRDYLAMYVMGYRFQMHALRNAVMDVLYDYYYPFSSSSSSGTNSGLGLSGSSGSSGSLSSSSSSSDPGRKPVNMEDVQYIFDQTPTDSPMRRFLVCQLLFFFFHPKRAGSPLPKEWATVMGEANDIGFSMFRMLNDWSWGMEREVPRMVVKTRNYFYDEPIKAAVIKLEGEEGDGGEPGGKGGGVQQQQSPQVLSARNGGPGLAGFGASQATKPKGGQVERAVID